MGRVYINKAAISNIVGDMSKKAALRAAERVRDRARANIIASGRIETAQMLDGFTITDTTGDKKRPTYRIQNTKSYFRFQEQGTRGSTAKPGGALRFKPKGSSVFIFRKKTGPVTAGNFLRMAKEAATPADFRE